MYRMFGSYAVILVLSLGTSGLAAHKEGTQLNILIVPLPFAGHLFPISALGEQLVRNGHTVTLCTPVIDNTDLQVKTASRAGMKLWNAGSDVFDTEKIAELSRKASNQSFVQSIFNRDDSENDETKKLLTRLNELLNNSQIQNYDMIIVDLWLSPLVACISKNFNVPFIVLSPGLLWHTSLLPTWPFPLLGTSMNTDLSLMQRLLVTIYRPVLSFFMSKIYDSTLPVLQCNADVRYLLEPFGHYVPLFITSVIGFEFPREISPLTSYVGPLLTKNPEDLPENLTKWLTGRPANSVVYVSMGSVIYLTKEMAESTVNGVLEAGMDLVWSLKEQNQNILQGMEIDNDKVFVVRWAPQLSVFAHPTTGAAVLHGGLGGIQEALVNSVPVVVIPITNDHGDDAARVEYFHLGASIPPSKLTASKLSESLRLITKDPLYQESIARLQERYMFAGGVDRAAKLVEHYCEIGYEHLVPAYAKYGWTWITYYNVDVKLLLFMCMGLFVYIVYRCCCCCCCRRCVRKKTKTKKD